MRCSIGRSKSCGPGPGNQLDEFAIIRRYFTPEKQGDSVIVGVGDDGAVLRPAPGRDLVTVVDTMVAGVHFPTCMRAEDIGYRGVAVNVSDIAAMGARPKWMTLALTLGTADPDWIETFAWGIADAADTFAVELVGGDLTRGDGTVISVQITGEVQPGLAMTRSGAQPGDWIYVSGTPGDAGLGLAMMQSGTVPDVRLETLVRRFTRPDARVELGRAIAPHASAAIDLSDGLFADLGKLLSASAVSGCIELNDLPMSSELAQSVDRQQALHYALSGGDDYELCFTAAGSDFFAPGSVAGVPVTRIGRVGEGSGLSCTKNGETYAWQDAGYRHFQ